MQQECAQQAKEGDGSAVARAHAPGTVTGAAAGEAGGLRHVGSPAPSSQPPNVRRRERVQQPLHCVRLRQF